jgi:N4-gp56 family major capsid protein
MANAFNDSTSLAIAIATAFDNMTVRPLKPNYVFDGVCREKNWNLNSIPSKGDKISFPVLAAFSANTAALDPTSTAINAGEKMTYTRRTAALEVYGDYGVIDTLQCTRETFPDAASDLAWSLMHQGMESVNVLARAAMDLNRYSNEVSGTLSSTYHYYGSQGSASSMGPLKAIDVRDIVADLKAAHVEPFADGNYIAIVNPTQSTQLRAETGNAAWRASHLVGDAAVNLVFNGDIGVFENVRFVVDTQVAGAGTGTISAYFLGREGCGKAIGKDLSVSMNPTKQGPHNNLQIMEWNCLLGYKIIRREALRIIETSSTKL